jgi:protein tyrosine/serine phosphatase
MADYLLTNRVAKKRARSYFWKVLAFTRSLDKARKVGRMFVADAAYLQAAWEALRQRHGSIQAFMEAELGIGSRQRAALRQRVLAVMGGLPKSPWPTGGTDPK